LFPLTANGNYDYLYGIETNYNVCGSGVTQPRFDHITPGTLENPFTGFSDLFGFTDSNENGEIRGSGDSDDASYWAVFPYDPGTGSSGPMEMRFQNRGNSKTSFGSGSINLEMDLSSNPAPVPIYTNGEGFASVNAQDPMPRSYENRFIWLNGLSITMDYAWNALLQCNDALITVRWDKYDVYDDVRWCGNIKLSPHDFDQNEPSLVVKSYQQLLLDKGKSPVHKFIPIQWSEPILPDKRFTDETVFEALPNSYIRIENEAEFRVTNGSFLWLKENSKLEILGNGKLIIEDGAYICVDPTTEIILQDNNSQFIIESGAKLGRNPLMNPTHDAIIVIGGGYNCSLPCEWNVSGNGELVYTMSDLVSMNYPTGHVYNGGTTTVSGQTLSFDGNLKITGNATITYTNCSLSFTEGNKILVEPGSKLILDGTTVTRFEDCGYRWNGIYVSGNSTASQSLNPTLFGTVILKNGAVIEHADGALNNFGLDANNSIDWNSFGGIIQCTDVIFKNNRRSGQFMAYTNKNASGNPINDKSFFKKCSFSIDNDMLNGSYLYAHISQWATRGIAVNGCTFSNTQTAADADRGTGILTIDARLTVKDHCNSNNSPCPSGQEVHSSFTGLRYGMHVTGGGNGNAVTNVSGATFTGNVQNGLYAGSTDNLTVAACTLNVSTPNSPVGIYLETTPTNYIHDNVFDGTGGSYTTGIVAKNLGGTAKHIYSNEFKNLMVGSNAAGGNKSTSAGLRFLCNNYLNNAWPITVLSSTPVIGTQGIAQHQGSNGNGAGNTFSGSSWYNLYTNGVQPITYWYVGTPPSYAGAVTVSNAGTEDCTNPAKKSTLMADYQEAVTELEQKQTELAAIEDAGDTEGAMMAVTLAGVGEELQLRNKLLQISPNVSEEVLKATVQKPAPMPNAMLRDVLVANPQAGKAAEVMEAVDMLPTPMDEHMLEQIEVASYSLSPKERKESEVAAYLGNKERLASEVVFELMQDSLNYNPKAAKTFLTAKDDLDADMELMKIHAAEGNTEGMDEAAARIAARQLSESEAIRMEGYSEYRTLEKGLLEQNKGWLQADSSEIAQLLNLSNDETVAGQYAQNILEFMGIAEFEKEVLFPVLQPEGKKEGQINRPTSLGFVTVQPVPAREYIIVKYDVSHLGEGAVFELLDVSSKPMLSHTLQNSMDETVIDLRGIKAGNYAYRVIHGGKMHYSGKVIVAD